MIERKNDEFHTKNKIYTARELRSHMFDILEGNFSISGGYDRVIIEEKLVPSEGFAHFCEHGLADIRIIVFNLVPMEAMVRMPTELSGGKANLAQGGAGFGIDIATGEVQTFFQNKVLHYNTFPEEMRFLKGKKLEYWNDILLYSAQIQTLANLGYLALDWVITEDGPKLLELNARAGLEVQNVNGIPLLFRLKKVENLTITDPVKGVEIARSLFHKKPIFHVREDRLLYSRQKAIVEINGLVYENVDVVVGIGTPASL